MDQVKRIQSDEQLPPQVNSWEFTFCDIDDFKLENCSSCPLCDDCPLINDQFDLEITDNTKSGLATSFMGRDKAQGTRHKAQE